MTKYFVAKNGSDTNIGSIAAPFLTIQRAADVVNAGDIVIIKDGVYRETVTFHHSGSPTAPITFSGFGDNVIVSGSEELSGWSLVTGAIYQTALGWDLGAGLNQVFVDGVMIPECRWPYPGNDISRPTKATVQSITFTSDTQGTIFDPNLTQPDGYWDGAHIHIMGGEEWICSYGVVNKYVKGQFSFTSVNTDTAAFFETYEKVKPGNHYYLFGKPFPTQTPGQWFFDGTQLQIWLATGDDPNNHLIEVKKRQLAFDFGNQSNVYLTGISTVAASIATASGSNNIVIDSLYAKYVSQFVLYNQWSAPVHSGITLSGSSSFIRNSFIQYSAGDGIFIGGKNNSSINNIIGETNYAASGGSAIHLSGSGHTVMQNAIYNSGRCGINHQNATSLKILNNFITNVMLQTTDGGGIYTHGMDGQNTEIAYNKINGVHSGGYHSAGIYFDNGSKNYNCHHNLTYDVDTAVKLNNPSNSIEVHNNTWDSTLKGLDFDKPNMGGSAFNQNIFTQKAAIPSGLANVGNVFQGTDPQFTNAANRDYTLLPTTSHPQSGCFELGSIVWNCGASEVTKATRLFDATKFSASSPGIRLVPLPTENLGPPTGVGYCLNNSWLKYSSVNFCNGCNVLTANVAVRAGYDSQFMDVRVDSISGPLLGTLVVKSTGSTMAAWYSYSPQNISITPVTGVHDLYLVFRGSRGGVCNIKSFSFV